MRPSSSSVVGLALFFLLAACGKKAGDVEGQWEVDIEKTVESVAKDPADLDLDPRMLRIKSMTRHVPPGDRAEIVNARKMELRPILGDRQMQVEFRSDGTAIVSAMKNGTREAQPAQSWTLTDGKVVLGGQRSFEFVGSELKGPLFDGHPGGAYLQRR